MRGRENIDLDVKHYYEFLTSKHKNSALIDERVNLFGKALTSYTLRDIMYLQ